MSFPHQTPPARLGRYLHSDRSSYIDDRHHSLALRPIATAAIEELPSEIVAAAGNRNREAIEEDRYRSAARRPLSN